MKNQMLKVNNVLINLGYGVGILDLMASCFLMTYAATIRNAELESKIYETTTPAVLPNCIKNVLLYFLGYGSKAARESFSPDEIADMNADFATKYYQIRYVFLTAVGFFILVLSYLLLIGLYRRHLNCCAWWTNIHCTATFLYAMLVLLVFYVDNDSLGDGYWLLSWVYAMYTLYRVPTVMLIGYMSLQFDILSHFFE